MQMMAKSSEEGSEPGLGWFDARVVRFDMSASPHMPLPHMGWNDVQPRDTDTLFHGIEQPRYYFLHSYYVVPAEDGDRLATADYAGAFTAAIRQGKIFGTQFHPEKSHKWGIDLLSNFART
jgi:glutamine amidotransferase